MKRICLFIFVYFITIGAFADFVPVKDAEKAAKSHFYQSNTKSIEWKDIQLSLQLDPSKNSEYKFYVFDVNTNEGWIVVSSDNNIQPVLAYSFEGKFNHDNMAPAQKALFDYYSESIEYASKNSEEKSEKNLSKWRRLLEFDPAKDSKAKTTTSPLLLRGIEWNQDWPYNGQCPEVPRGGSGGRAYVGCVATSMGQVMKYYNWPPSGTGSATNSTNENGGFPSVSVNFQNQTYNWFSIPDNAVSDNSELGKINLHIGVSVKMSWGADGSGSYTERVALALKSYFKYASNTQMKLKSSMNEATWKNTIKQEIDGKRPIIYAGQSSEVGHAWNCDGYQETEDDMTFHMNWGWGGSGNGYCTVNELISAGSPGGPQNNFNNSQKIVVGIAPNAEYPASCTGITTITGNEGTFNSGNPRYNYQPNKNCTYVVKPACGKILNLKFTKFNLAANDVVEVYRGDENSTELLATLSSENLPPSTGFSSEEGVITLKFRTASNSEGAEGWTVEYSTVTCNSTTILTEPSGVFDDGSGPCKYGKRLNCLWRIEPAGEDVNELLLNFNNFKLANRDALKIYKNSETPSNLVGDYDGSHPAEGSLLVESGVVLIRFTTSSSSTLEDGWQISYSQNTSITNYKGSISDLYVTPNPGNADSKIVYTIKKNADAKIFITNILGKTISEKDIHSIAGTNEIYLNDILNSSLNSGIYYINIQSEGQIISTKYIVID